MKLYKALKTKKDFISDINRLKYEINNLLYYSNNDDNSSSLDKTKLLEKLNNDLMLKVDNLIKLKNAINESNKKIQFKLYKLEEYKNIYNYWLNINKKKHYKNNSNIKKDVKYFDNINNYINELKKKIESLQDEIDEYNFNVEIDFD